MKSKIKTMKWQDVTLEQLNSHWDMCIDAIEPITYSIAKYMNAYAYGDIAGEGIDVRCEYADEVVSTYLKYTKAIDIYDALNGLGWIENLFDDTELTMHKHNDYVRFEISNGDAAHMTMSISDGHKNETDCVSQDYYDIDEVTIDLLGHTQVVNERNIIDLFQKVCKKYFGYTEDAGEGMRNLNLGGHIIQVYPYNEHHKVWCIEFLGYDADGNGENNTHEIGDLAFNIQVQLLIEYERELEMKSRDHITFDGDCIVFVGADGRKRRYALIDNSHDRQVIADAILNSSCDNINTLMHRLGIWSAECIKDYNATNIGIVVHDTHEQGYNVALNIEGLSDNYIFGSIHGDDYSIIGIPDERDAFEELLNIDKVVDTILSSDENFNIYKSLTNQN